jgi:hypothetical protein
VNYDEGNLQRTVLVVPNGDGTFAVTDAADDPMWTLAKRFGLADVAGAEHVTTDTTLHTPASGAAVRLRWIYLATPKGVGDTVVTVSLGATDHFIVPLPSPGVFMRTSIREGAADGALTVALSADTDVYVNYELEEFTP